VPRKKLVEDLADVRLKDRNFAKIQGIIKGK
jgi:hypothetical protein